MTKNGMHLDSRQRTARALTLTLILIDWIEHNCIGIDGLIGN